MTTRAADDQPEPTELDRASLVVEHPRQPMRDLAALHRAEHWAKEAEKALATNNGTAEAMAAVAQAWAMVAIGWQGPEGPSDG